DSRSMKTIAIMTMVFLPATFLSAVFAMPLLKFPESSNNDSVIQDGFDLFLILAFTLTALVFATCYVLAIFSKFKFATIISKLKFVPKHILKTLRMHGEAMYIYMYIYIIKSSETSSQLREIIWQKVRRRKPID